MRGGLRVFRGDRIVTMEATSERFERPEDFDVEEFRRMSVTSIGTHGTPIRVRFAPGYARYVAERFPPKNIVRRDNGSVELSFKTDGPAWAARWVLKHGLRARALEPESLVAEVADRCKATLALYEPR